MLRNRGAGAPAWRRPFDAVEAGVWAIARRSCFPRVHDLEAERQRVGAVRIAVAAVMLLRTAIIAESARYYFPSTGTFAGVAVSPELLLALAAVALLALLLVGLWTPLTCLLLLASYSLIDSRLGTHNLATNTFLILLVYLLVTGSGSRLSLDALLARNGGLLGRMSAALQCVVGSPSARGLEVARWLLFTAFALLNLVALYFHGADPYWLSGDTVRVLQTNTYLSRAPSLFRAIESAAPAVLAVASIIGGVLHALWQALALPLVFTRWGYRFVAWYGAVFIGFSLLAINLSFLPLVEVVLWSAIFLPPQSGDVRSRRNAVIVGAGPVLRTAWVVALCLFLVNSQPFRAVLRAAGAPVAAQNASAELKLMRLGLQAPDVFNVVDLQMGDTWAVIYRRWPDGRRELVPYTAPDGRRLAYHRSDLVYFANSLRWRRATIGAAVDVDHRAAPAAGYLFTIAEYDRRRQGLPPDVVYEVEIRHSPMSDVALPIEERYETVTLQRYVLPPPS